MIRNAQIRLVKKRRLTADVTAMEFAAAEIADRALPGNFVQIRVREGLDPIFRRPMSVHGCGDGRFEIVFRAVGKGTSILARAEIDQVFDCLGPLGNTFMLPSAGELAVLLAGGVGFPPLHFFARHLIEKHAYPRERIIFLFGARSKGELAMAEDLGRLGVDTLYSTDDGSFGFAGTVAALFENLYAGDLRMEKIRVYACGPDPLLRRMSHLALSFKIPCQLSLEGHMPCGLGTCLGCAVKIRGREDYYRICYEGPVFDALEVEI